MKTNKNVKKGLPGNFRYIDMNKYERKKGTRIMRRALEGLGTNFHTSCVSNIDMFQSMTSYYSGLCCQWFAGLSLNTLYPLNIIDN